MPSLPTAAADLSEHNDLVVIVGEETLLNQALRASVATSVGVECRCCGDVTKVAELLRSREDSRSILLVDQEAGDYAPLMLAVGAEPELGPRRTLVALYNCEPRQGIEKRAFEKGIRGFFYRTDQFSHFLKGVKVMLGGDSWVSRGVLVDVALQRGRQTARRSRERMILSNRETQILALVGVGASNEEIADKLRISHHTVKTHLYNIFKKVNVPNRFQAALWAARNL